MHSHTEREFYELTPIESLLGQSSREAALLLGILVQMDDATYHLEDPTGHIRIDLSQAEAVEDFFVTEHCILLCEGVVLDDIFYVTRLGHPLIEDRIDSVRAIRQHVTHPRFSLAPAMDAPPMVVVSDVALDQPQNLQMLERLFCSYEHTSLSAMPLFVLMGNFCSTPAGNCRALLEELASVIARFDHLAKHAHFCVIPGPNDVRSQVLPLPALSCPQLSKVAHMHMESNPCRIEWGGLETVLFRYDLLGLLTSQHVVHQRGASQDPPHCRLIKTVISQGHLVPVAGVPVYWNYDEALRLYPLPHTLILGGDASETYNEVYHDCRIVHPGSLARRGDYAVVHELAGEDDGLNDVEFGQLGVDTA